jgi:hypothetical protein
MQILCFALKNEKIFHVLPVSFASSGAVADTSEFVSMCSSLRIAFHPRSIAPCMKNTKLKETKNAVLMETPIFSKLQLSSVRMPIAKSIYKIQDKYKFEDFCKLLRLKTLNFVRVFRMLHLF